jgi:hypothetical protein
MQRRYLKANEDIADANVSPDQLSRSRISLEAAILHIKKIQWFLTTTRPCSEQLLSSIIDDLLHLEQRIGTMVHHLSSVLRFY